MKTSEKVKSRAEHCGITITESFRVNNYTKHKYICNSCGAEKETSDTTLLRWYKNDIKYCPACRGTGKGMTPTEKVNEFNSQLEEPYKNNIEMVEFIPTKGKRSECVIKFVQCSHTKEYRTDTVKQMMKQGKALKCDTCNSSVSAQEEWSGNLLPYDTQVKFSDLFPCDRGWVADYVVDNLIIEVTTESKLAKLDYLKNMIEKTKVASDNDYGLLVVTSLNNIKDIVRSLSKDKERQVTV